MGRVVHALLLTLAVVVVTAMPSGDAGGRGAALASEATASDPSQLTSSVPVARRDLARKAAVEIGARIDRSDSHAQQLTATLVPAVEAASRSALYERVDEVARLRILTIATRASGRGPPTVSSPASA